MTDTKQLTPQQSFEEKVIDRLREDIGELIPDEVLADMVNKCMKKLFFTGKEVKNNWGQHVRTEPPLIEKTVKELMSQHVDSQVGRWLADNRDQVRELIGQRLDAGILEACGRAIQQVMSDSMMRLQIDIENKINTKYGG